MGKDTLIEWTNSTLNFVWGCTKVSDGCTNCYMYRNSVRWGRDPYKVEFLSMENNIKKLKSRGFGPLVFVNSNSDTFHKDIPFSVIDEWFELFSKFPDKQFQILTKRDERMVDYFYHRKHHLKKEIPPNVWIGVSIENNNKFDRLYALNAAYNYGARVRFVSFEPLLEKIDFTNLLKLKYMEVNWVIIGGESGTTKMKLRKMEKEWVEDIIHVCKTMNIPIFFKQWGGVGGSGAGDDVINETQFHEFPNIGIMT